MLGGQWKEKEKVFLLSGQWKEKEKVLLLNGQWKEKEKVLLLSGQWKEKEKVLCLVANGRKRRRFLFTYSHFPPKQLYLNLHFLSFDIKVLIYHGPRPFFTHSLPFLGL